MDGNVSWCEINHVEFIKEIASIGCLVKHETMHGALDFDTKNAFYNTRGFVETMQHAIKLTNEVFNVRSCEAIGLNHIQFFIRKSYSRT
ncbi:unnamed protein product [Sphagnum troendelagicum]|uniref:Uncharacterized protein n=1 Tax=Sphagnum troendelagicum TaxID=128251 RepID=A0ABP0TD22_9BRYO